MVTTSRLPITPLYLQNPVNFLEGDLGAWSSDALIAWGSDRYIYLKESRISSNDGERIDAYVLDQYGEIVNYYEGIFEGDSGVSVSHIQISSIEGENLYFSYQTNVWSGISSPSVSVSSLSLDNFTLNKIFKQDILNYTGSFFDRIDHQFVISSEGDAYLVANFADANIDNIIGINLDNGQFINIKNLDFEVERLVETTTGFAVIGIGHTSYYTGGKEDGLHLQFFDNSGESISDEIYLSSRANDKGYDQYSLLSLSNGNVALAYSNVFGRFVKINIYSDDGSRLLKEIEITGTVAKSPDLFATSDGGFLLSFLYTDNSYSGDYYYDQVMVRFDELGNQVSDTLREVTGDYYKISTLAVDQDGGVIGISGNESGIESAVFLAQMFGTSINDEIIGTDDVNTIFTFGGDDTIYALGGNDYIDAGSGKNLIYGGLGNDQIWLSEGDNIVDGGPGSDWLIFGDDVSINLDLSKTTKQDFGGFSVEITNVENVDASNLNDIVIGNEFANEIWGRGGNDTLKGDAGDDLLYGGDGNDILDGGDGDDILDGGAGNDTP
jgi:Ca2+-binding RTX toxin-like protein